MAWDRTLARLAGGGVAQHWRLGMAAICGVLVGAFGSHVVLTPTQEPRVDTRPPPGATTAGAPPAGMDGFVEPAPTLAASRTAPDQDRRARPDPVSTPGDQIPVIRLGKGAVGLPFGPADLLGEARVNLSPWGSARAHASGQAATVELSLGRLDLQVDKRAEGRARRFDVVVGPYRFSALETTFRIARDEGVVRLSVSVGRVAVYQGSRRLAVIESGGRWSSRAPGRAVANGDSGGDVVPRSASKSGCAERARRDPRDGVDCYLGESRSTDLGAEVALYEVARLRRDELSDPAGALEALRQHRHRFPAGALGTEVDLSIAELLPRLGRYREALDVTTALLATHPGGERVGELQLLRGHVLREGLRDCAGAERAYAAVQGAVAANARATDAAAFWRAVCLETLGRRDEARAAYRRYLDRPHAPLADPARRRLDAIGRQDSHEPHEQ